MIKKENRSVRKTKQQLKDAFLSLLDVKSFHKITVKELCEIADINRGTFYFHYQDLTALLAELEDQLINDLKYEIDDAKKDVVSLIDAFLAICDKHVTFFLRIFENKTEDNFITKIQDLLIDHIHSSWQSQINQRYLTKHRLAEHFISGGILYTFYRYRIQNLSIPIEERSLFIKNLLYQGILTLDI